LIVLLGAAWLVQPGGQPYRGLIVLGLSLSLAGDILLVLPANRFLAGLAAFLLAHVAYIAAFGVGNPLAAGHLAWLPPFLALGAALVAFLWRGLGALRAPVCVYTAVVFVMLWRAAVRGPAVAIPRPSFVLALTGACLFVASDTLLAIRRFRRPFRGAHSAELAAYWLAQLLIALSVRS
jgi:alkenylglycerophosphocholine hydrolase